jgi:hypothetical protein
VAYKAVTSVLREKFVARTRSSKGVRRTKLHWPDAGSQLWCEFMSTICMGMYTGCQNLFAAHHLGETCAGEADCEIVALEKSKLRVCDGSQHDFMIHESRPVILVYAET